MIAKLTRRVALSVTALVVIALTGFWVIMRSSLPVLDGTVPLKGLSAPVQIHFDKFGIPHIQAQIREDRNRLFQMDLLRRHSAGRLAEIVGQAAVKTDTLHRVLGLKQATRPSLPFFPLIKKGPFKLMRMA